MQGIVDWVVRIMGLVGAPGVGLAILLETVFPPIPSELVLPLAGFTAAQGEYWVVSAIIWATVGSVAGALLMYWLGAAWGQERLGRAFDKIPLASHRDVDRAVAWFERHGRSAVLLGRLVPGVRSLVSIPAGINHMPMAQFLTYTTLGSAVWNTALVLAGFFLGNRYTLVQRYVDDFANLVLVVIGGLLLWFFGKRMIRRVREHRQKSAG